MKWIIALAALLTAASVTAQNNTPISFAIPPERFHGQALTLVAFVDDVNAYCVGETPPGTVKLGCTVTLQSGWKIIYVSAPCKLAGQEFYARLLCHEIAHFKGWSRMHEE